MLICTIVFLLFNFKIAHLAFLAMLLLLKSIQIASGSIQKNRYPAAPFIPGGKANNIVRIQCNTLYQILDR